MVVTGCKSHLSVRYWPKADTRGGLLGPNFGYLEVFGPLSVCLRPKADTQALKWNVCFIASRYVQAAFLLFSPPQTPSKSIGGADINLS